MPEKTIDQQLRDELAAKAAFYRVAADGYEAGRHNSVAMNWLRAAADYLDSVAARVAAAVGHDIDIAHFTSTPFTIGAPKPIGDAWPECSGDPACCPENEGRGCCKPNPPWSRDNETVMSALLLVGDTEATAEEIAGWTDEQAQAAQEWALALHFYASDNDDVVVPPRPDFIRHGAECSKTGSA